MYKSFYNLQKNPFEITPDPSFLFATKAHNEALAALYYGVKRRKGFVVMTGEVGTGKTLLVRCLLHILTMAQVSFAYVFNSRLTPMEFLQYVAGDFGLATAGKSKSELLLTLADYLIGRSQQGLTTVLVVDEAHHLSEDVLEEVRLLTNMESPREKLLQILLVGQQELDEKLDSTNLRQLKQRIALRSQLGSLDLEETIGYVHRRLELAGSKDPAEIFGVETVHEIFRQSRGLPRLINTICENALIHGYARQMKSIPPSVIAEIGGHFRLSVEHSSLERALSGMRGAELERAARTLLDFCQNLRTTQEGGAEIRVVASGGTQE